MRSGVPGRAKPAIQRRRFIALAAAGAAWPLAARAQEPVVRKLGYLSYGSGQPEEMAQLAAFEQRLTELGWQVGTTLSIQYRFPAGDVGKMQIFAEELVADDPDVLVACATPETAALKNATNTIPIIFWANTDPVGSGLVESLAHPGGNVTGFQGFEYSLAGQWIDLLHKAAPAMRRVGFIYNPTSIPFFKHYVDVGRDAAGKLGLEFIDQPVRTPEEIEPAFAGLAGGDGGSVAPPDSFTAAYVDIFASSQRRYGVPAIFAFRSFPQNGGLMSYGYNELVLAQQTAEYADRVLRGARPADLPVQAPRAYDLVVNLPAARALGLTLPPDLLARSTQVIE